MIPIIGHNGHPQQDRPQPGTHISVGHDGPAVVVQVVSTLVIPPAAARQLIQHLASAAIEAEAVARALAPVLIPMMPDGGPPRAG